MNPYFGPCAQCRKLLHRLQQETASSNLHARNCSALRGFVCGKRGTCKCVRPSAPPIHSYTQTSDLPDKRDKRSVQPKVRLSSWSLSLSLASLETRPTFGITDKRTCCASCARAHPFPACTGYWLLAGDVANAYNILYQ